MVGLPVFRCACPERSEPTGRSRHTVGDFREPLSPTWPQTLGKLVAAREVDPAATGTPPEEKMKVPASWETP
jgi:hypothetical protein